MTATVGVDVGGTYIKAVRRDPEGQVERRVQVPTPRSPREMIDTIEQIARSVGPGAPVGVGLAGLVDSRRGVLVWAPHLSGEEVEVVAPLRDRLGVPVVADNDANLAAIAEHRQGAAVGAASLVMITLGTGIGMGTIIDGELYHGQAHAGEVGHFILQPNGLPCECGRRGCWETTVSGRRLDADARSVLGPAATASDLVAAARSGNPKARECLDEAAHWLAQGIETVVLTLDPAMVVVGGAAAQAGELLLGPVRDRLERTEGAAHRTSTTVAAGILGPEAGAIGAAIRASEESGRGMEGGR